MAFYYKPYEESASVKKAREDMNKYQTYNESQKVKDYGTYYDNLKANRDTALSPYKTALDTALANINNREAFSYDMNADALYNQYKQQYIQLGKLAMQDTIGQASTLTGGYGNSYAASAGNQAYQNYLTQLNDKATDFYGLALDKYQMEGEDLANKYALASDRYDVENSDYQNQLDRAYEDYNNERNYDYNQFTDNRTYFTNLYNDTASTDREVYDINYNAAKDMYNIDEQHNQWEAEFNENMRQFNAELAENQRQANQSYNLAMSKLYASETEDTVSDDYKPVDFIARIRTASEFARGGDDKNKYGDYKSYIKAMMDAYRNELSDKEWLWLEQHYGLT